MSKRLTSEAEYEAVASTTNVSSLDLLRRVLTLLSGLVEAVRGAEQPG